jgi:hypothetical protein
MLKFFLIVFSDGWVVVVILSGIGCNLEVNQVEF